MQKGEHGKDGSRHRPGGMWIACGLPKPVPRRRWKRRRQGEEPTVNDKSALADVNLQVLDSYFADVLETADLRKLTYYVWYTITMHFCLRGGEVQCMVRKSDLVFNGSDGKESIRLATDFMSKNHSGGVAGTSFTSTGTITDDTQVKAIRKYLSHLHPDCDRLFQRAKTAAGMAIADSECIVWFMKSPLSHNILSCMTRRLSADAQLSHSYFNHCLRATAITLMKKSGLEDRNIMAVSDHKNVQSLQAYDRPIALDSTTAAAAVDRKPLPSLDSASFAKPVSADAFSNPENIHPLAST